jgi:hypothetical protein
MKFQRTIGMVFKAVAWPMFVGSSLFMAEQAANLKFSFLGLAGLFVALAFYQAGDALRRKPN